MSFQMMISNLGNYSKIYRFFRNEPKNRKKKRDLKRKYKKTSRTMKSKPFGTTTTSKRTANRPLLEGVSIFELIMPWKAEAIR